MRDRFGSFTSYATPQVSPRARVKSYGRPVTKQVQTLPNGKTRSVNKTQLNNAKIKRILERKGQEVVEGSSISAPISSGAPSIITVPYAQRGLIESESGIIIFQSMYSISIYFRTIT